MTALIKVKNPSLITSERVICAVEGTQERSVRRRELGRTESKEEESGELSIRLRMPTTYFHPVGLRLDDLDCDAALLPSIFFSSLPPSVDWSTEITVREQSLAGGQDAEHVTD